MKETRVKGFGIFLRSEGKLLRKLLSLPGHPARPLRKALKVMLNCVGDPKILEPLGQWMLAEEGCRQLLSKLQDLESGLLGFFLVFVQYFLCS